jgi:uncharacterized protein (TIGR03435 family)
MRNRSPIGPSRWKKLVLGAAALAGLGAPIVVGILHAPAIRAQDATDWQTRAGGKMAFDVASIKPSKGAFVPLNFSLDPSEDYLATNGRLRANDTLASYIEFAYKVLWSEVGSRELSHFPKWLETDLYSIEAQATGKPTKDQMRLMVQALLADRVQLTAHFETREVPVFELRLAKPGKPGPKLISHADAPPCDQPDASPVKEVPDFHFICHTLSPFIDLGTTLILGTRDVSMDVLAGTLSDAFAGPLSFGRPIIDKTGLTGRFDFMLEWARERRTPAGSDSPVASDPIGPTLLEALRDQLGLKLESTKASIPILVIDKVERPSEN